MGTRWGRDDAEMGQRWDRDGTEMGQRWHRDGPEMGAEMGKRCQMETRWAQDGPEMHHGAWGDGAKRQARQRSTAEVNLDAPRVCFDYGGTL